MHQVIAPHGKGLHEHAGFQQHIERDACHDQPGIDEVSAVPPQHHGEVKVAVRPMIAAGARAEQDRPFDAVTAFQPAQKGFRGLPCPRRDLMSTLQSHGRTIALIR